MTNEDSQNIDNSQEIEDINGRQTNNNTSVDALPFLVGIMAETGDLLRDWLIGEKAEYSSTDSQARYAALGLTSISAERIKRGVHSTKKGSNRLASLLMAPGRAVFNSRPFRPIRSRFDKLVERGNEEVNSWIEKGRETELRGRQATRQTFSRGVREITLRIGEEPAVDELVKRFADNYIAYLNEHPELVEALIRDQGDVYIEHLKENPEQVQALVQGQSTGLVTEVTDQVRERTVTADTFLEMMVRSLLRKGERQEVDSSTPEADKEGDNGRE